MTEKEARALARGHMDRWGLSAWTFAFSDARAETGRCYPGRKEIRLSRHHAAKAPKANVEDTVLHEIAHALDFLDRGTTDHGSAWKRWARRVGASPERTADVERDESACTWFRVCSNCGWRVGYFSKPWSKKPRACARCCEKHSGGRFDERFVMEVRPAAVMQD